MTILVGSCLSILLSKKGIPVTKPLFLIASGSIMCFIYLFI